MKILFSLRLSLLCSLLWIGLAPASAESLIPPGWLVTTTANVKVGPKYPGSDELSFLAFPSLSFRRVGEPKRFSTPDDGLSLAFYDTAILRAGLAGRFRGGRYFEDDRQLFGFKDVPFAIEPGVFVEFWPLETLRLRAEIRRGFNGHDGFVADLGIDVIGRFDRATVSVGPRLALGDSDFTQKYFGVRQFEADINGLVSPFKPSGGVTSLGIASALSYDWSPQWSTTVSASYNRLVGDAADSPIVKRFGSENQFSFGLGVSYTFSTDELSSYQH